MKSQGVGHNKPVRHVECDDDAKKWHGYVNHGDDDDDHCKLDICKLDIKKLLKDHQKEEAEALAEEQRIQAAAEQRAQDEAIQRAREDADRRARIDAAAQSRDEARRRDEAKTRDLKFKEETRVVAQPVLITERVASRDGIERSQSFFATKYARRVETPRAENHQALPRLKENEPDDNER
ncbi:MAG: hypothetical protein H0W76_28905 [Pyrinomonadaceae bacterium]|nr:hypothetical protein [Pyrinomonadaceae bacterium]